MVVKYRGRVPFFVVVSFLATRTAHIREPIFKHNSSKDAVQRKEVPFTASVFVILTYWGSFSAKTPQFSLAVGKSQPNEKVE